MTRKIVFLIDSLQIGGTETSLLSICERLKTFTPIVIVLFEKDDLRNSFERAGVEVIFLKLKKTYNFHKIVKNYNYIIKEIAPCVIHSSLFYSDMSLRFLDLDIPKVSSIVSNSYSYRRTSKLPFSLRIKNRLIQFFDKITANRIDLYISNSNTISENYSKQIGISMKKIKTIFRGRSTIDFYPIPKKSKKNVDKKFSFIVVGRLIVSKGHKELILAFNDLIQIHPQSQLIIVGEGPERGKLEALVTKLDLTTYIVFLGSRNDVADLLRQADFFVFPSRYEGLPGALIEAMFVKIPIICSNIPENRECVDETMALFHRVGDQGDLVVQMEKALTLDWEIKTQKAYNYAVDHFEIEKIVIKYEETYCQLINT